MEEQIKILEERIDVLETILLRDPWEILLDDMVREYIYKKYPYCESCDGWLYARVLEEMKDKIKRILMEDE